MPDALSTKIAAARRRWRVLQIVAGAALTLTVVSTLAIVSFWSDRALVFTTPGRSAWLIGLIAACAGSLALFLLWPLLRPVTDVAVATLVEGRYPSLNERLLSTLSLAGAGGGISHAMVSQLALETERIAGPLDFPRAVPTRGAQRPAVFASLGTTVLLLHLILMPQAFGAWIQRIFNPGADIPVYAYTRVWVSPEDKVIPRGEDLVLGVRTEGRAVDRATIRYRFGNGPWAETQLQKPARNGDERSFAFKLNDVQQDVTFFAQAGDGQANAHTVRVEERPALLSVRLTLDYPDYTGKRTETVNASSANIVAPVGTHVGIEATANKPLDSVACSIGGAKSAWQVSGDRATGAVTVQKDASGALHLTDTRGFTGQRPTDFSIRAQQDQVPQVKIEKPGGDIERTPIGSVDLRVLASDDYGIEDLRIGWQAAGRSGGMALPTSGAAGSRQLASGGSWGLAGLQLKGGDTITYEALARDNDNISGPHVGRSAKYQIHIVSTQEMKERLETQKEQEKEAIKQLIERQKEAQKQLARADKERQPEQTRQAEAAQRQVAAESAELAQRMKQTSQQMAENNLTTKAEQSRRDATQQELSQLSKQEMPQAAESIKKQDLQSASQQEQAIQERLQSLTDNAGPVKNVSELAQTAEQLANQQQKLAEKSANAEARMDGKEATTPEQRAETSKLAKEQAALNKQTSALKQQLNQAAKEAAEQGKSETKALQEAAKQLDSSGVQQKQSSAQQQLQSGKPSEASSQQNSAAQDLQKLADKLDQASQQTPDQMSSKADKLDKLADRLQETAREQQSTASAINRNPDAAQMQKLAQTEQRIGQTAGQIGSELQPFPNVQEQVQRATQNIGSAEQQLKQSASEKAASVAREAARQLLQASMDMRQAATAMRQAADAKSAQEKVDMLAREQLALRDQTKGTDQAKKGSLSPEQEKQVGNQAEKQRQLMTKSNEVFNDVDSNAMKMIARQINSKMGNAARNLEQKNTGSDTQRRQTEAAQILQRISRSLGQEAKSQQQQGENPGDQDSQTSDMAQAADELRLAREMEAQIRQETGGLDERRKRNPDKKLTAEQQQELEDLARMQRETEQITQQAASQVKSSPELNRAISKASELMADAQDQMIRRRETGEPTQSPQEKAVGMLDQAIRQQQQAMRQQQQQQKQQRMAQSGQQQGQQPGQKQGQQQQGSQPNKGFSPVVQQQPSQFHPFDPRGKGFNGLDPRATQSMREGRQEKVPAEYRDLVNQYFKALSKGK
jgi:hypothetical protein